MQWIKTHCSRMDHGGCGIFVGVESNWIDSIKPDPEGFLNHGHVCPSSRLLPGHPLRNKKALIR